MIFLDTQDESVLFHALELINSLTSKDEILVNALSKSGGTTETMSNLEVIIDVLKKKFGDVMDRIVFTTDDGSKMHEIAKTKGIDVLTIPKTVGGRFSVLSAVGLFPFVMAGFNVKAILTGAQKMRDLCLTDDPTNPAILSASLLYYHATHGKNIHDLFTFLPQLESLGKWYRQLMGESLGKDEVGLTPTVSVGSTDLHSVGQLYLGGPKDKITTFLYTSDSKYDVSVPEQAEFDLVDGIQGKKISHIMHAIVEGTKIAYKNQSLPFMEVVLDTVSEETLGEFVQFKMMEMMYLGHLMKINAFDQPHVELYKKETRRILQSS
jgi:glucose-6-phosphate isomerase